MIRAVWLVVFCGVVFALAAAVRDSGDATTTTTAETEPATVGVSLAQDGASESTVMKSAVGNDAPNAAASNVVGTDTLTKADRLEVAPPPAPVGATTALPVAALPAEPPPATAPAPAPAKTKAADRSRRDAHAKMIAAPAPARQAKTSPPKTATTVARAKAEPKCRRPDGFAGFLRTLNIGPRCAT